MAGNRGTIKLVRLGCALAILLGGIAFGASVCSSAESRTRGIVILIVAPVIAFVVAPIRGLRKGSSVQQRLLANCLDTEYHQNTSAAKLSALISEAKKMSRYAPLQRQIVFAAKYNISMKADDTRGELSQRIWYSLAKKRKR